MNKLKISFLSALVLGSTALTSCDDFLTKTPTTELSKEGYWVAELNAKSWLAGTYSEFQNLSEMLFLWGEARSDNFYPTSYNTNGLVYNALLSNQSYADWTNLYRVVGACNVGIENVDKVPFASEVTAASYKGQWLAMRALMYFYAIRVWGDVPLVTKVWDGDFNTKYNTRNSVEEVRVQIMKDLDEAIPMLDKEGIYYMNRGAALALKADVQMWFHDYEGALATIADFEQLGRYDLAATPTEWKDALAAPADANKECIFNMFWDYATMTKANPFGQNLGLYDKQAHYGMSNTCFQNMLNDKKDIRFWASVDTLSAYNSGTFNKITLTKGTSNIGLTNGLLTKLCKYQKIEAQVPAVTFASVGMGFDGKIPVYRTADVLLLKAEALNRLNRPQEAIDIVNACRKRAGSDRVAKLEDCIGQFGYAYQIEEDPANPGNIIEKMSVERLILDERQIEFYGEGKRWWDLRRTGYVPEALDEQMRLIQMNKGNDVVGFEMGSTTGPGRLLFPLHNKVFTSNPKMIGHQNEPYSE